MKTTKIEWADSTASPWYGCTKVSPGCGDPSEWPADLRVRQMPGGAK